MLVLGLVMIYSVSAVGVPLHYHYCKGDLEHVTLLFQKECSDHKEETNRVADSPFACCLKGKMSCEMTTDDGNCCDDETELLQLDDEVVVQSMPNLGDVPVQAVELPLTETLEVEYTEAIQPCANAPPQNGPPVYLMNCSFVFYG